MVFPLVDQYIRLKGIVAAGISRQLNQYKIYFDDGTGLIMTQDAMYADQKLPNFTLFSYKHIPTNVTSVTVDDNNDIMLFCDKDGYVYREDIGNNCDGEAMEYVLRTPFINIGSNSIRKSFKHVEFDIKTTGVSDIRFSYQLSYGQVHTQSSNINNVTTEGAGGYWGSARWSDFVYGTALVDQQILSITGTGHNFSALFYGNSATTDTFSISTMTLHYLMRRLNRG
jgi:hypothetical protein